MPYGMGAFRTPRTMRLERDLAELKKLRDDSTIFDFKVEGDASAPEKYTFIYRGKTLVPGKNGPGISEAPQRVTVDLGGNYPRTQPNLAWTTPILHPNIWGSDPHKTICLGNFHNQWTPYVRLVDMAEILWDMGRLAILNPHSAGTGGRDAHSEWSLLRRDFDFPVDRRPLRDKVLAKDEGSSIIRPGGKEDEVMLLDDDDGACSR